MGAVGCNGTQYALEYFTTTPNGKSFEVNGKNEFYQVYYFIESTRMFLSAGRNNYIVNFASHLNDLKYIPCCN